jgi:hypothetical protein
MNGADASSDASIPLLTDVIEIAADDPAAASPEPAALAPAPAEPTPEELEAQAVAKLSDEQWIRLERRIRERILRQILARSDTLLEQKVRDTLADVLQTAVEALANDIRASLHRGMEDVVSRAVSQEITRLQETRK